MSKTESKPKKATTVTAKQRKYAKEYVRNGGNGKKAAKAAYNVKKDEHATQIASRNNNKPAVQDEIKRELERQGITIGNALRPIAKGLEAKVRDAKGGLVKDEDGNPIDDLDVQLKSSDRALKLLGVDTKQQTDVNVSLSIDAKRFGGEFVMEGEVVDEK